MRAHDYKLDATGLLCPEPLMLVRNRVREIATGEVLYVVATDPSTERDFINFCRFMNHTLLQKVVNTQPLEYWIRKGG